MYWLNVQGLRVKAFVVCCLLFVAVLRLIETCETTKWALKIKDTNSKLFVFVCLLVCLFVCVFACLFSFVPL